MHMYNMYMHMYNMCVHVLYVSPHHMIRSATFRLPAAASDSASRFLSISTSLGDFLASWPSACCDGLDLKGTGCGRTTGCNCATGH